MAAGKGTRMKSDLPKVLHPLCGRPMIHFVVETAQSLGADPVVLIVGYQHERVEREFEGSSVRFAVQEPQLGTAHAIMCALPQLEDVQGSVLILSGDVPLIKIETLNRLWSYHRQKDATATVLTARTNDPFGYGRIMRQSSGNLKAIVEERDASDEIRKIEEINGGIYIFELDHLRRILPLIGQDNDQQEYYLTNAVRILSDEGSVVAALEGDFKEIIGINTVAELQAIERELTREKPV